MNFGNDDEVMERSDGQWGFMKVSNDIREVVKVWLM